MINWILLIIIVLIFIILIMIDILPCICFLILLIKEHCNIITDTFQKQRVLACLGLARARVQQDYDFIASLFVEYKLEKENLITAKKIIMNYGLVFCYDNIEEEQVSSLMRLITTHHQINSLSNENKYLLGLELVKRHTIPENFKKKMTMINKILEDIRNDAEKEKESKHLNEDNKEMKKETDSIIKILHFDRYLLIFILLILLFFIIRLFKKGKKEHNG